MSPHTLLKAATRDAHDTVDAAFAAYDLGNPDDYRRFLVGHAAAFLPAEQALAAAGAGRLIPGWDEVRRSDALIADLADLDIALPAPAIPPTYDNEAAILGGAYVLEGSRLGGAVLRKAVGPGLPRRFLDSIHEPGRWRDFVALLNRSLYDTSSLEEARRSALATFALFA